MAVTSGFYNSLNHDRRYNAIQVSSIFDGIIEDGVYETIGDAFVVKETSNGDIVEVGTGRAWFDHSWTLNDSVLLLEIEPSEVLLDRIDAVVLDVNGMDEGRKNDIVYVQGAASSDAQRPTLINEEKHHQYPLAYISRKAGSTAIKQADITNTVGTSECPFVIGVVKTMEIDFIVDQWSSQWNVWLRDTTSKAENDFFQWMLEQQFDFTSWYENIQAMLDGDVAANLANAVLQLEKALDILAKEKTIYRKLQDDELEIIQDNVGNAIDGRTIFSSGSGTSEPPTIAALLGFEPEPAQLHRSVFRGKNLGSEYTEAQQKMVLDGTFDDIWVGDYWEIDGIKYRVADIDDRLHTKQYYGNHFELVEEHSIAIIPDNVIMTDPIHFYSSTTVPNTYTYAQCLMYNNALTNTGYWPTTIRNFFSNCVWKRPITYMSGRNGYKKPDLRYLENPTVGMIFGTYPFASTEIYSNDTKQLALFALQPNLSQGIESDGTEASYWTRDINILSNYPICVSVNDLYQPVADNSSVYIRPVFYLLGRED